MIFNIEAHPGFQDFLDQETLKLLKEIEEKIADVKFYPLEEEVLSFLKQDVYKVKYVIIGLDPYPQWNDTLGRPQATGRAFAPASLIHDCEAGWEKEYIVSLHSILKAIYYRNNNFNSKTDKAFYSIEVVRNAIEDEIFEIERSVSDWFNNLEKNGFLFLNKGFTVEAGKPGSHTELWGKFLEKLLRYIYENANDGSNIIWFIWTGKKRGGNIENYLKNTLEVSQKQIIRAHHPVYPGFVKGDGIPLDLERPSIEEWLGRAKASGELADSR